MTLHCDLTTNHIFVDGIGLAVKALPSAPEGVKSVRVSVDGLIERYSESDWAWKPAPELAELVADLQAIHAATWLELHPPKPTIPVVK